ncbi:MAG: hypothetical protein HKP53_00390 [Eudoraea sp.]|nr:hypothetical protein [Eudoraea sp.]
MAKLASKLEVFYAKEGPYKEGLAKLRELALQTDLEETLKWGAPVYTINNKNVLGIIAFKSYFGLWFYNGCYLKDPEKVLENAQEGKTKAMRHWKFQSVQEIPTQKVLSYIKEAIENQKNGLEWIPERTKKTIIPPELKEAITKNAALSASFKSLAPYKQREYCEYIATAKQEKTKQTRLKKIIPMILEGHGFNDKYR